MQYRQDGEYVRYWTESMCNIGLRVYAIPTEWRVYAILDGEYVQYQQGEYAISFMYGRQHPQRRELVADLWWV